MLLKAKPEHLRGGIDPLDTVQDLKKNSFRKINRKGKGDMKCF